MPEKSSLQAALVLELAMTVAPDRYFGNPLTFVAGFIRTVSGFLSNIVIRNEHFGAINDILQALLQTARL